MEIKTDKESKKIDPYCCAVKGMVDILPQLKTVGHVPREISRHIFFFLKEGNGKADGFVYSTQYQRYYDDEDNINDMMTLKFIS